MVLFFVSDKDEEKGILENLEFVGNAKKTPNEHEKKPEDEGKENGKKGNDKPEKNVVKPIVDTADPQPSHSEELVSSNAPTNNQYPEGAQLPGRKMSVEEATEATRQMHLQSLPQKLYKDRVLQHLSSV